MTEWNSQSVGYKIMTHASVGVTSVGVTSVGVTLNKHVLYMHGIWWSALLILLLPWRSRGYSGAWCRLASLGPVWTQSSHCHALHNRTKSTNEWEDFTVEKNPWRYIHMWCFNQDKLVTGSRATIYTRQLACTSHQPLQLIHIYFRLHLNFWIYIIWARPIPRVLPQTIHSTLRTIMYHYSWGKLTTGCVCL